MSNNESQRVTRDQIVERQRNMTRNQRSNNHENQLRNDEKANRVTKIFDHDEENDHANIDQRESANSFELVDEDSHESNHITYENQNASQTQEHANESNISRSIKEEDDMTIVDWQRKTLKAKNELLQLKLTQYEKKQRNTSHRREHNDDHYRDIIRRKRERFANSKE